MNDNYNIIIDKTVKDNISIDSIDPDKIVIIDVNDFVSSKDININSYLTLFFINSKNYYNYRVQLNRIADENKIKFYFILLGEANIDDLDIDHKVIGYYSKNIDSNEFKFIINRIFNIHNDITNECIENFSRQLEDTKRDFESLINIGKLLSLEKNHDNLLRLILKISKQITGADAGSIYLVEEQNGNKILRFKHSHTFSKELPYEEFTIPMDKNSIAGYVAITQNILNIPDVYKLGPDDPVAFNSSFDKIHNYRSKSMLVVPMINHLDETIGVIQLINSKEDVYNENYGNEAYTIKLETEDDFENKVVPFEERYESLMEAVASQAAIAIENNRLLKQIQNQFDEFVKASIVAVESRDVATKGHSFRVANICLEIAKAINDDNKYFKNFHFNSSQMKELEYAALLHDFGKVYIDASIFLKANKLYDYDLENLLLKIDYLYRYQELKYELKILNSKNSNDDIEKIKKEKNEILNKILNIKNKIIELNNPMVVDTDISKIVDELVKFISELDCYTIDNKKMEVFNEKIIKNLTIKRGSLNDEERKIIESHVLHTYNFVSKIPWPKEYEKIPEIALKHHEKLDGSGYPYGIKGDEIPLQSRIMTVADIFDALLATDRPYKPPVSMSKILEILKSEANEGKLDKNIVDLFIEKRIYEKVKK